MVNINQSTNSDIRKADTDAIAICQFINIVIIVAIPINTQIFETPQYCCAKSRNEKQRPANITPAGNVNPKKSTIPNKSTNIFARRTDKT